MKDGQTRFIDYLKVLKLIAGYRAPWAPVQAVLKG